METRRLAITQLCTNLSSLSQGPFRFSQLCHRSLWPRGCPTNRRHSTKTQKATECARIALYGWPMVRRGRPDGVLQAHGNRHGLPLVALWRSRSLKIWLSNGGPEILLQKTVNWNQWLSNRSQSSDFKGKPWVVYLMIAYVIKSYFLLEVNCIFMLKHANLIISHQIEFLSICLKIVLS